MSQKGFDPTKYLNLHLNPDFKDVVSQKILDLLSQYFIIRILELIPDKKLSDIKTTDNLFKVAQEEIPNYNSKIKEILEEFKKEYQKNTGTT